MIDADVLVVGAGAAGLAAARRAHELGLDVRVLEARDRLGGRVWTEPTTVGVALDLGAQFVGAGQTRVLALAAEDRADLVALPGRGDVVVEDEHGHHRSTGWRPRGLRASADAVAVGATLAVAARRLDRGRTRPRRVFELDQQSAGAWIDGRARTTGAAAVWRHTIAAGVCADPDDISVGEVMRQLTAVGGIRGLLGAERWFVAGGMARIVEALARPVHDRVLLGTPVARIEAGRSQGVATVVTGVGTTLAARRVVLAVPPRLAARLVDPVERARHGLDRRWVRASVVKTMVVYHRPWWRERGLRGRITSLSGPTTEVIDSSPDPLGPGVLCVLTTGPAAERLALTRAPRQLVVERLDRLLGPGAPAPLEVRSVDWAAEAWSAGGYATRPAPGHGGRIDQRPDASIVLAGTEHAGVWRSYVEGAIRSGESAAELAAAGISSMPVGAARP